MTLVLHWLLIFEVMWAGSPVGLGVALPQKQTVPQLRNTGGFMAYSLLQCKYLWWKYLIRLTSTFYFRLNELWRTFPKPDIIQCRMDESEETKKLEDCMGGTHRKNWRWEDNLSYFSCGHNTIQTWLSHWLVFTSQSSAMHLKHGFWNTDFHFRFCFSLLFYISKSMKIVPISISLSLFVYIYIF